jgi:serine protease AprX
MSSRGRMTRRWIVWAVSGFLALTPGHFVSEAIPSDDPEIETLDPAEGAKLSPALAEKALASGLDAEETIDVIVSFHDQAAASGSSFDPALGAVEGRVYASLPFKAVKVPAGSLKALAKDPSVSFISPDSDVFAASESARQTARVPGSTPALNTPNAAFRGTGVTVAVLDTGVWLHCDYYRAPVWQLNFLNGAGGILTDPIDPYGHGTHVAGMVTGDGYCSSNAQYQGASTKANVVSLRVLDAYGRGRLSDVLAALDWIVYPGKAQFNIRVANLSFGKGVETAQAVDPLVQAVNAVWDAGVVVVVSAGNFGGSGHYTISSPGNSRKVITVGSLTDAGTGTNYSDDFVSTFSSSGPTLFDHVLKPDLVAPGNKVVAPFSTSSRLGSLLPASRIFCGVTGSLCPGRYMRLSGTSMAAAVVSGAVARMLEKNPSLTPSSVKARLMKSSRKIPGDPTRTGTGVLDVEAAMNASGTLSGQALSPLMGLSANGTVVYVQNTAQLWGSTQWAAGSLWSDGYLWSSSAPLGVSGYLWSNGSLWSDSSLWADGSLWSTGFLWSEAVQPTSVAIEDPDEVNP